MSTYGVTRVELLALYLRATYYHSKTALAICSTLRDFVAHPPSSTPTTSAPVLKKYRAKALNEI